MAWYGDRPRKEKLVFRGTEEVYLRKCPNCRCWFGTPWYRDVWCCQACEDADKRRQAKFNGQKARIIKKGDGNA